MQPGDELYPGHEIYAWDNNYSLVYQPEGQLQLHRHGPSDKVGWESRTKGTEAGVCVMRADGNLVLYDPDNRPLWESNIDDSVGIDPIPNSRLVVRTHEAAIYGPDGTKTWWTRWT
jgi:hypothetical protein